MATGKILIIEEWSQEYLIELGCQRGCQFRPAIIYNYNGPNNKEYKRKSLANGHNNGV